MKTFLERGFLTLNMVRIKKCKRSYLCFRKNTTYFETKECDTFYIIFVHILRWGWPREARPQAKVAGRGERRKVRVKKRARPQVKVGGV